MAKTSRLTIQELKAEYEVYGSEASASELELMYHMASGMFRKVVVERETAEVSR